MLRGALRLFTGGLVGKILGLVREALLAFLYGTSDVVAANRVAQTAVFSPLNVVGTDALSGAYLPLQTQQIKERSAAALSLYRGVQRLLGVFGVLVVIGLLIARDQLVGIVAPDLPAGTQRIAVSMAVAMLFGVPAYLHFGVLAYLEMAHHGYRLSSLRASGQSIGLIAGTVLGYMLHRPSLLAWGFTVAYVLMSLGGTAYLRRAGMLDPTAAGQRPSWAAVRPFLVRIRVLVLIPVLMQVQVVTEKAVASGLGVRTVAAVDYARLISDTALLLVAVPIGLAALPTFATMPAEQVRARLTELVRPLLTVAVVASAVAFAFARPLVQLLFQRGAFDAGSTAVTASIFAGLSLGLWAVLLNYILLRVLNALDRRRLCIGAVALTTVLTLGARPLFVHWFGPAGLGLAASLGAAAGALVVLRALGVGRRLLLDVALLLPGVGATVAVGRWVSGHGLAVTLPVLGLVVFGWLAYLAAARPFRTLFVELGTRVRAARRPEKVPA